MSNKNIRPRNHNGQPHGLWESYLFGELWNKRFYQNGKSVGYEENYWHTDAKLSIKTYYL